MQPTLSSIRINAQLGRTGQHGDTPTDCDTAENKIMLSEGDERSVTLAINPIGQRETCASGHPPFEPIAEKSALPTFALICTVI